MVDLDVLLRKARELDPMPDSALRLAVLLAQEDWILEEIVGVIELDPALTGRLLSRANSVLSGSREPISTVRPAVIRLGPGVVLSLALSSVVRREMERSVVAYGLGEGELWRHAVASALAVDQCGSFCRAAPSLGVHAAALLHDVGKLVLDRHVSSDVRSLLERTHNEGEETSGGAMSFEAEGQALGVDHAWLGGEIARAWKLPPEIVGGIAHHHLPDKAGEDETRTLASFVALADAVAHQIGAGCGNQLPGLSKKSIQRLGINRQGFDSLSQATSQRLQRTLELYS